MLGDAIGECCDKHTIKVDGIDFIRFSASHEKDYVLRGDAKESTETTLS